MIKRIKKLLRKKKSKDNVYLWTGNGWGKTTSALGVCMRAIGQGKKVSIVQFMKGRKNIGEYKIKRKLKGYSIHQFGKPQFVDLKNPSEFDKKQASKGLMFAKKLIGRDNKNNWPFLLVLDEINIACRIGLLNTKEVIDFLDTVPKYITVYLTGRYAPKKLIARADYATRISPIKRPPLGKKAKVGIDY